MMAGPARLAAVALAVVLAASPLAAQQRAPQRPPARAEPQKPEPPPPPPPPPAPYEASLLRLSELLGVLAFMRDLCGEGDGVAWRGRMNALVEAEGTTPDQRARLAGAYNRGYRGYQHVYRQCTPAARVVISRSLAEAGRLSRDIATRYGG